MVLGIFPSKHWGLNKQNLGFEKRVKIEIWVWVNTYRYICSGMNIHLPTILGFTRYQGFDPSPFSRHWNWRSKHWDLLSRHYDRWVCWTPWDSARWPFERTCLDPLDKTVCCGFYRSALIGLLRLGHPLPCLPRGSWKTNPWPTKSRLVSRHPIGDGQHFQWSCWLPIKGTTTEAWFKSSWHILGENMYPLVN